MTVKNQMRCDCDESMVCSKLEEIITIQFGEYGVLQWLSKG